MRCALQAVGVCTQRTCHAELVVEALAESARVFHSGCWTLDLGEDSEKESVDRFVLGRYRQARLGQDVGFSVLRTVAAASAGAPGPAVGVNSGFAVAGNDKGR